MARIGDTGGMPVSAGDPDPLPLAVAPPPLPLLPHAMASVVAMAKKAHTVSAFNAATMEPVVGALIDMSPDLPEKRPRLATLVAALAAALLGAACARSRVCRGNGTQCNPTNSPEVTTSPPQDAHAVGQLPDYRWPCPIPPAGALPSEPAIALDHGKMADRGARASQQFVYSCPDAGATPSH